MFIDPVTTLIAALKLEPEYSAKEAAELLRRSYSWLDQGLRKNKFVLPDGRKVEPRRTAGGYRRFSLEMLEEILICSYHHGWLSLVDVTIQLSGIGLLKDSYRDTGAADIPRRSS